MIATGDVERLIVFRFDRDPLVCRERIAVLRRLNPGVPILGLYGGPLGVRGAAVRVLAPRVLGLDSVFVSPHEPAWNWKNGDLALLEWFRSTGHRLRFDVLHLLEWDLLMLEPLAAAYAHIPPDAVGLTALAPLAEFPPDWRWTTGAAERLELAALVEHVHAALPQGFAPRACLGAAPCFPRAFLEAYAAADPPALGNDEVRLPLYSAALGHQAVDTGLVPDLAAIYTDRFFNLGGEAVTPADVVAAAQSPTGPRVLHPVRERVPGLLRRLPRPGDVGAARS